jgi:hypothetical protein
MSDRQPDELRPGALREALDACKSAAVVALAEDGDHACFSDACRDRPAALAITLHGRIFTSAPNYRCVDHWTPIRGLLIDLGYAINYTEGALDLLCEQLGCPT